MSYGAAMRESVLEDGMDASAEVASRPVGVVRTQASDDEIRERSQECMSGRLWKSNSTRRAIGAWL